MSVIDGTSGNDTITPDLITRGVTGTPTAFPGDEDDELHGHDGNDSLNGGGGSDFIFGDDFSFEAGNDTLDGGAGADYLYGAYGDDTYIIDNLGDQIFEATASAGGVDTVRSQTISVNLGTFDYGGLGIENITLFGNRPLNATGTNLNNVIIGNTGANLLYGGGGNDLLDGLDGADWVRGQSGNDTVRGGVGTDTLIGGSGADTFQFRILSGSTPSSPDHLLAGDGGAAFDNPGAAAGDRIDVANIDANVGAGGNQAFLFGGTGTGRLWLTNSGTDTIVLANVDGDGTAEFRLVIHDGAGVTATSYTAGDFLL